MITDLSPYLIYELGCLKGQHVRFCRYSYKNSEYNEGFALVGDNNSFFIRIKNQRVADKHDVYFLVVKAFHNSEIGYDFKFDTISEGKLTNLNILKYTNKGMIIRNKVIQNITTECGLLAEFSDDSRFMVYPKQQLFTDSACSGDLDEILDEISANRLEVSRSAEMDINLLLSVQ
tara:strand:- start:692 stop:1216 length:525 start_codon:yes stop_codon:yes gene_type:complete